MKIPDRKEIIALIGTPLYDVWTKLCAAIDEKYDMECFWNSGGKAWDYEYKYRRGGKTLCALYVRESCVGFMVIFGKAEREKFENARMEFSQEIREIYDEAKTFRDEHLCCIIRSKKPHPGVEAKRQWISDRLKEGHVFRKLNVKGCVFIEYAPLETAWVPIIGDNYYYVYCLWVSGSPKGSGYGKLLMEYCLADAKAKGKSGVCMLGAKKQKSWLSDQSFAKRFGFEVVDTTDHGYELLALSYDGTTPKFAPKVKNKEINSKELTIYYDMQCPYIYQNIQMIKKYCDINDVPVSLVQVDTLEKAKELPCVFNNWAVFYKGNFETVNLLDAAYLERILKK